MTCLQMAYVAGSEVKVRGAARDESVLVIRLKLQRAIQISERLRILAQLEVHASLVVPEDSVVHILFSAEHEALESFGPIACSRV